MVAGSHKRLGIARKILRAITPPIALSAVAWLRLRKGGGEWEYIPEGWQAARTDPKIKGWNVESVLEAYKAKWPSFVAGLNGSGPLGLSPEATSSTQADLSFHNSIMSYGYALALATRHKRSIALLDWGGGIGHYYLISRTLIPDVAIDYSCKDLPLLAEYGQQLFPEARFFSDETCLDRQYDFVLASGSLQYSEDWVNALRGLAGATGGHLFVTRLPIVHHAPSYVFVQRPYQYDYDTEYLGWCLNRGVFLRQARDAGLVLVREFMLGDRHHTYRAPEQPEYRGFLFRRAVEPREPKELT